MTTALFGKRKFGTFKFGPTVLKNPRYGLEIDWDSNGLFSGENEGVNLNDMTIERGRKYTFSDDGEAFKVEDTGNFSAILLDLDRRYDPYNVLSPLFGMLSGGKKFRASVRTPTDNVYPLMAGVMDEPLATKNRGVLQARLNGRDGWSFLRDQRNEVTVALQENIYVDDAIALVLDKAGWPRLWDANLDAGVDQRPYFWVDARSAAQVIHELAHNELGNVCIRADGKLRFLSRLNQDEVVMDLVDANFQLIERLSPSDVVKNILKINSAPRSEVASQTVWQAPQRLEVPAGETISDIWVDWKYNNEIAPAKNVITPVATTDYDAYSNSDGTGTNLTANISVTLEAFSTRGKLTYTNSGLTNAHVICKVRATPIPETNNVSFQYRDDASIRQFGARPFTLTVDQNVNVARQYRELLALFMTNSRNYLSVQLMPEYDIQFSVDLGDLVHVVSENYAIDGTFRVIYIKHNFRDPAGIVVGTRWILEPYSRVLSGVQIPMQIPFQLGGA